MPQKTRLGKHAGEVGSGSEGSGDGSMAEHIVWDKTLADAEYLEELVKILINESAALKKL